MGVVLLVRHGQASFGADDYDVLSETGWEQSRLLGTWLAARGVAPRVVMRGNLRRHRETSEGLASGGGWACEVDVDPGWDEFDHLAVVAALQRSGEADRLTALPVNGEPDPREFQRIFELATARWASGDYDDEYLEAHSAFISRVRAALDRACAAAGSGETVVVVSSGGPIAAACAALVDPDGDDPVPAARLWRRFNTVLVNSSMTRVVAGSTGARMLTFNEHPHLEGETLTYR